MVKIVDTPHREPEQMGQTICGGRQAGRRTPQTPGWPLGQDKQLQWGQRHQGRHGLGGDWCRYASNIDTLRPAHCLVTTFATAERLESGGYQPHGPADSRRLRLFSGTSNPELAQEIGYYLGVADGPRVIKRFADGELYIQIQESIRGCDVFLIQPTCAPVNDHLMELVIMVDACRRASARQITAVIPYYGYARADRKTAGRESITAKLVANLLVTSGVDRVLAMDLHSSQIQGYFDIPCDHIYGSPVLVDYLGTRDLGEVVVVSPDVGGVARARAFAKQMNDAPLAIIDKRRSGHNVAESLTVIGDVHGKTAILIDDMIDTGGTICQGAKLLRQRGAARVLACATHAVFSPPAVERLSTPGLFEEVVVTNSIPITPPRRFPQLQVLSVANMLGEAIWRIHQESSVSSMFR
jgi:ribose-phosphate pyrophosphokinase